MSIPSARAFARYAAISAARPHAAGLDNLMCDTCARIPAPRATVNTSSSASVMRAFS